MLHRLGVDVTTHARPFGIDGDTAYFTHTVSGEPVLFAEVDTLVLALPATPDCGLEEALANFGGEVVPIGDCLAPRTCDEAALEGLIAGTAV